MSLLMDALKQAEHAKRDRQQPQSEPPATAVSPSLAEPVTDAPPPAELSLALVEPAETESRVEAPLAMPASPILEPDVSASPTQSSTDRAPRQDARSAEAAGRILAVSQARQAAQRRRQLVGILGLGCVMALAVGAYYYYAALAQTQPYLGLPQPPASPLAAEPVPPEDEVVAAEPLSPQPKPIGATAAPSTETPWREGPPPADTATQEWERAPVDPRVLRGERPSTAAEDAAPATPAAQIRIRRSQRPDRIAADLHDAYAHYQGGRWTAAEAGYRAVLEREPANRDAQLGMAALATRAGQPEIARKHYRALLQRNPKDATALAALADLAPAGGEGGEAELKLRLLEQPGSAALHFALANLYAGQQRWPLAQQAYFEAQRLHPAQPDYAFNLAVSLEHLGQSGPALDYYRRALALAESQAAQFDRASAEQRIAALAARIP